MPLGLGGVSWGGSGVLLLIKVKGMESFSGEETALERSRVTGLNSVDKGC